MGLTKADWQGALDVQCACNLSGVVISFAEVMPRIWEEARVSGKGTEYVNTHPICVLYADKVCDLTRVTYHDSGYSKAFSAVQEAIKGFDRYIPDALTNPKR